MKLRFGIFLILPVILAAVPMGCSETTVPKQARDLIAEARFDEARELLEPYLEENPDDFAALMLIGDTYLLKGVAVRGTAEYDPEAAELGKKAIEYYRLSRQIHLTRRSQDRESEASQLLSPP